MITRTLFYEDLKPGTLVKHFKGDIYRIIGVAKNTETEEELVIYCPYNDPKIIYGRSLQMFLSEVDKEKYPYIDQTYRFKTIHDCKEYKSIIENSSVSVLGTDYALKQYVRKNDDDTALGLCDFWNKIIYIDFDWYVEAEVHEGDCYINRMFKTIRHELIHAFLYEMGNTDYAYDERLADKLSIKANQLISALNPFSDIVGGITSESNN